MEVHPKHCLPNLWWHEIVALSKLISSPAVTISDLKGVIFWTLSGVRWQRSKKANWREKKVQAVKERAAPSVDCCPSLGSA